MTTNSDVDVADGTDIPKPVHFAYAVPDKTALRQGDVLRPSAELRAVLSDVHPYFSQGQYKYFIVLTPSCGLVHRDGLCSASHITIAAVRTIDEAIKREARLHQEWWMEDSGAIDDKKYSRLFLTVERMIDNSEPGYFFLPEEIALHISGHHCAFLRVAIALKTDHYKTCLDAKIAQLKDSFQAKLGWNVGVLYNQVGTTEWDREYGDGKRSALAKTLLGEIVKIYSTERIREAIKDLRASGSKLTDFTPDEIIAAIGKKKVVPKKKRFSTAAQRALDRSNFLDRIASHLAAQTAADDEMIDQISDTMSSHGISIPADTSVKDLTRDISRCISERLRDKSFDRRLDIIKYLVAAAIADPSVDALLK